MERLLGELDFPGVELADSGYLEVFSDDGRCFALGAREDDVDKVLGRGNHGDLLEVVVAHLFQYLSLARTEGRRRCQLAERFQMMRLRCAHSTRVSPSWMRMRNFVTFVYDFTNSFQHKVNQQYEE